MGAERNCACLGSTASAPSCLRFPLALEDCGCALEVEGGLGSDFLALGLAEPLKDGLATWEEDADRLRAESMKDLEDFGAGFDFGLDDEEVERSGTSERSESESSPSSSPPVRSTKRDGFGGAAMLSTRAASDWVGGGSESKREEGK